MCNVTCTVNRTTIYNHVKRVPGYTCHVTQCIIIIIMVLRVCLTSIQVKYILIKCLVVAELKTQMFHFSSVPVPVQKFKHKAKQDEYSCGEVNED